MNVDFPNDIILSIIPRITFRTIYIYHRCRMKLFVNSVTWKCRVYTGKKDAQTDFVEFRVLKYWVSARTSLYLSWSLSICPSHSLVRTAEHSTQYREVIETMSLIFFYLRKYWYQSVLFAASILKNLFFFWCQCISNIFTIKVSVD